MSSLHHFIEILIFIHFTSSIRPEALVDGTDLADTLSVGSGIEREVLQYLYESYRQAGARYMLPRADGLCTIATSSSMVGQYIAPERLREVTCFGAITALTLINGLSTHPLDPAVLQYLIFGCDLNAIHRDFCAEWHPELRTLIDEWLAAGHLGDVRQFERYITSYLDRQVWSLLFSSCSPSLMPLYRLRPCRFAMNNHIKPWLLSYYMQLLLGQSLTSMLRYRPFGRVSSYPATVVFHFSM